MRMNRILVGITMMLLLALPAAASDDYTLGIFGNANEDETINMQDVTYTELIILEYRDKTELSDGKHDGEINMQDVTQIELIILGKEKELTVLDLADRTVTINKPVERIVMTFYFEESIAIDGKDIFKKIVGWNRGYWEGRRQWVWEKYTKAFPEIDDIPDVGYPYKGTFNAEKVVTLKPDIVVVSTGDLKHIENAVKQLEQAGVPVVVGTGYSSEMLETHPRGTLMLGYVFDKEERAQEIVDFYTEQITDVYSRVDEVDKPEPKVYIEGGYSRWRAYGPNDGGGLVAAKLGAINIAEDTKEINPEQVLDANPDIIIITGAYWTGYAYLTPKLGYFADPEESREILKQVIDRPGWDTINAVKNKKVYSIHHELPWHGFVYSFVAAQYFAKCFYPDVFEDLDPEENFKEFHERFMLVDYSGVWMLSLEEETE